MNKQNLIKDNYQFSDHNKPIGFWPVLAALIGNFIIFCLKLAGFLLSGSGSMFSEAIHSLADTSNQALLMIGIKMSAKKPDKDYAYGYGQERFLWALISACGIFFVGAGATTYHGFNTLLLRQEIHISYYLYVILIISFIVESITFYLACRALSRQSKTHSWIKRLKYGDPTTVAIVYEDGVALLGVVVAFISIVLTGITGKHYWDSFGSIFIGLLLAFISVLLINKNRQYLRKKSIPENMKQEVIKILKADASIERVLDFKSTIIDFGKYQIKCEIEFNGSALMRQLMKNGELKHEYDLVKDDYEEFMKFIVEFTDKVPRLIGTKIDDIEKKIQKTFPEIVFIDIELN